MTIGASDLGKVFGVNLILEKLAEPSKDSMKTLLAEYLRDNPYPEDEKIHALAERQGVDPDELETAAYALMSDFLSRGKFNKEPDKEISPEQLAMGEDVEKEHTSNPELARRIAKDHLVEFGDYYTRLKKMEQQADAEKSAAEGAGQGKQGPMSPVGLQMDQLITGMKRHKAHKTMHEHVQNMNLAVSGTPPEKSQVKKAYEIWKSKLATETGSEDSSEDNSALETQKAEEENIIDVIRRGWANPVEEADRELPENKYKYLNKKNQDGPKTSLRTDSVKDRAKTTPDSPDTTI